MANSLILRNVTLLLEYSQLVSHALQAFSTQKELYLENTTLINAFMQISKMRYSTTQSVFQESMKYLGNRKE